MKFNTALIFALGTFLIAPLSFTSAADSGKGEFDVNKAAKEIDALVEAGLKKHGNRVRESSQATSGEVTEVISSV